MQTYKSRRFDMARKLYISSKTFAVFLTCVSGVVLSGCAETTFVAHTAKQINQSQQPSSAITATRGNYKIGSPYQIQGRWYTPAEDMTYTETGTASWYGPNFHGKPTANGEIFDMYALTAAHRTLPLPSVVRVTNLSNNHSIIVRVNDRGPFARDRILDVSKAAAKALGFLKQGTAKVRVDILPKESLALKNRAIHGDTGSEVVTVQNPVVQRPLTTVSTKPVAIVTNAQYIQVGAFGDPANANRLKTRLSSLGPVQIQQTTSSNGVLLHKVRIGPIMNQQNAETILNKVHGFGYVDAHVISPKS